MNVATMSDIKRRKPYTLTEHAREFYYSGLSRCDWGSAELKQDVCSLHCRLVKASIYYSHGYQMVCDHDLVVNYDYKFVFCLNLIIFESTSVGMSPRTLHIVRNSWKRNTCSLSTLIASLIIKTPWNFLQSVKRNVFVSWISDLGLFGQHRARGLLAFPESVYCCSDCVDVKSDCFAPSYPLN